ncbi:hypothetical protein [Sulfurovum sp.]|uniref:hypothetical protein n=1 Tax=Sulfurovum sp. TaxID=1969726 RepID=UPI003561CB6D
MGTIIQKLDNHSSYDNQFIVCAERKAVHLARKINKTCRENKIAARARSVFPGVVFDFGEHLTYE